MTKEEKVKALTATAEAFEKRAAYLQYDQLSLDREVRVSSRRNDFAMPEAATSQHYLFLDCSSFVWACFYQTFDYMMEADLTWHIIDYVKPRIFYYEITGNETEEEEKTICDKVKALMEPGDTLTWKHKNGNGHIMLYLGDNKMIHCTSSEDVFSGYKYDENKNYFTKGGIRRFAQDELFAVNKNDEKTNHYLFNNNRASFAVHRPLDRVEELTENTKARLGAAKDLFVNIESNYCGGKTADPGEMVEYTVFVRNDRKETADVNISFIPGKHSSGESLAVSEKIAPKDMAEFKFMASAALDEEMVLPSEFVINDLKISGPAVMIGKKLSEKEAEKICADAAKMLADGSSIEDAIYIAYKEAGYKFYKTAEENLHRLYFLHDALSADVLSRRPQHPFIDGCVMTYFGGRGVVTPPASTDLWYRTNYISLKDLLPGDVIAYGCDACLTKTSEVIWTGEKFLGTDEDPAKFADELFGKFCFALFRPSQKK